MSTNAELLTSEPFNHEADVNPRIIAPDPSASNDCFDVFSLENQPFLTKFGDDTMNSEDEPLSGLNGRLRPRKSAAPSPQAPKAVCKPDPKPAQDRPKRTSTPSKAATTKLDDLANKSDLSAAPQLLCPYCDRKFASKQTVSKHARRIHLSYPKQDSFITCLFCSFSEANPNNIIRHMVETHPNQYFACLDCHTRFPSSSELEEHKLNVCEKQKEKPYRSKLRQKVSTGSKKSQKALNFSDDKEFPNDSKDFSEAHRFNGIVISCELKPSQVTDEADIEDNITTNLILPPSKTLGTNAVIEKNAVIVLDDIQWNKRMPTNFSFHNTDADQILSRLGVVHRSPRTGESTKKDWFRNAEEQVQKFEKCFDTGFYSKVASNVHENLTKFLDGSFNFNPDPDSIIKTRKSKNSVVINTAEGFPILLAFQQYSRNVFDGYIPRSLAPRHKWKWENDKTPLNPDDIKRDTHVNNCIITLVSSLDIWTQLCMRRKFEDKFSIPPLEKKTEKQNTISRELKHILESRELPTSSQQVVKYVSKPMPSGDSLDFPASLGLKPSAPPYDMQPAVLSGEWVRPRCYVCCACGAQTRDSRGLSSHISTHHPNAQVQHYEIVGELLLNADILKHLYVPPSQMCNRTRPLRGFRECTKCNKSISLEDLHQHMLDCAGDMPTVRRKCRYRPFGVRRRRPRLPDNTIRRKIRKDIRSRQTRQKTHMRPRPIRSEVGDAETIRKMLADLPAKRHRVMVNPMNPILRPRRKLDKQRNMIIIKRRTSDIVKNRKQRDLKKVSDLLYDDNDNKSTKSDDDMPLKPRIKRVLTHVPRQSDSLKRKVALNRAKRRAKIKEQRANANENTAEQDQPTDMTAAGGSTSNDNRGDQLSIDNSPQRIDVNGGPNGAREQSSRGSRSGNRDSRDDQRSGSSGSPNGNPNNNFGPMQNIPLKHSIARLTAETDAHDRSLQYHHLYLMQPPECTEIDTTQHVPSGQHRVFENEAVVTKLDKPPLHFHPPTSMDAYAYHRNKLPKPKKGLNDCIAMLKNKLVDPIPAKISHAMQCGTDERLDCESILAHQRPPLDYQLNMNSRPAEIFSRHQVMPERYIDYSSEANMTAQNFAELPFHFMPSQRIAFNLPPPESKLDPRYIRNTRQKSNEGNNKKETARRRSTRSDKGIVKNKDLNARAAAMNYPGNVSTPSKVNSVQGRRSSSQNVSLNANMISAKRRASVSYNRSNARKQLNEYEAILAQQRALEFRQRISPEAHLMELAHPETFAQTQINKQNQLIAEQMIENYISKKQLAICVENNYTTKMLTAAYAESMYANSRHASISPRNSYDNSKHMSVSPGSGFDNNKHLVVSPGSRYDNNKHLVVSPGSRYDNNKHLVVSPGSRYDNNKHLVVSPGSRYDNNKHLVVSPGSRYDNSKHLTVSPGNKHDNGKHNSTVSPGSGYNNSKHATVSPGNRYDNNKHGFLSPGSNNDRNRRASISPRSKKDSNMQVTANPATRYDNNKVVSPGSHYENSRNLSVNPGNRYDNSKHASISPRSKYDKNKLSAFSPENQHNYNNSVSPGSNYDHIKHAAMSSGSSYNNIKHVTVSPRSGYDNSKLAVVTSGINYENNKQAAISPGRGNDGKSAVINPDSHHDDSKHTNVCAVSYHTKKQGSTSPGHNYISKKQAAVAADGNYNSNKHTGMSSETHFINKKQAATSESNYHKKLASSPENVYNKTDDVATTIVNDLGPSAVTTYDESTFISKKAQAVAGENKLTNKGQIKSCADPNYITRVNTLPHVERNPIIETQAQSLNECDYGNTQAVNPQETPILAHISKTLEGSVPVKPPVNTNTIEIGYSSKNYLAASESNFDNKNQAVPAENYTSNQVMQCSDNHFINKNLPDVLPERDAPKISVEYYTETQYNMPTAPPVYGGVNSNYQPMPNDIEAPLDLSKSTSKDSSEMLKEVDGAYASDNYDNYETLDLSNKGSEADIEDVVVDLSVKISSPNLDMGSKLCAVSTDEMDSATDLSIKPRDLDDSPTDLTVKRKPRDDEFEYELQRNPNYIDEEMIQDLSGKKTPPEEHNMAACMSPIDIESDVPTDLSGKSQDAPLPLTAAKFSCKPNVHMENNSDGRLIDLSADLSSNRDQIKQSTVMHSQDSLPSMASDLEQENSGSEVIYDNCSRPSSVGECSYIPKAIYDSSAQQSQYELHNPSTTSNTFSFIGDTSLQTNNSLLQINDGKTNNDDNIFGNNGLPIPTIIPGNGANVLISTATGPIPLYTLSNTIMPVAMSKYESTTPVYTLTNACISMAKAEPSNITPLSDAILSIPSTTIVSVAPMYTLTDTTVSPSINYMQMHNKAVQDVTSAAKSTFKTPGDDESPKTEKRNICISSTSPSAALIPMEDPSKTTDSEKTDSLVTNDELDPETAKKIALLPKELVEILGTMPVDHRKQLLNVLPQYVSTSCPTSQNDTPNISTASLVNRGVSPTRLSDFDIKPSLGYSPVSSSQIMPITAMIPSIERLDETKSFPIYQPTIGSEPTGGEATKYEPPEHLPKIYEIDGNTVIDLTEDDVPLNTEVVKVTEDSNNSMIKSNEPVSPPLNKSNKQKVNDQTASLRAVRIKAPSERNKSVSIDTVPVNKSKNEQVKSNVVVVEEKDNSSDLDKTLAIQQAEISSTQHNTNISGNCKYPLAISPSSTEYSGDESSKPISQQSPVPIIEIETEKVVEKKYEKPIPKAGMVSSSISTNEVHQNEVDNVTSNLPKVEDKTLLASDKELNYTPENIMTDKNLPESHMDIPILQHEEDSDDDISLATIVKQKQRDQVKLDSDMKSAKVKDNKNFETKKKKKDKKSKKGGKKTQDIALEIISAPDSLETGASNEITPDCKRSIQSNDCDAHEPINNDDVIRQSVMDNVEANKHYKKKAKKGRRNADMPVVIEKPQMDKVNEESEKDINKENDSTSEVINNKVSLEDNTSNFDVVSQNKDPLHEDKIVSNEPQELKKIIKEKLIKDIIADPIIKISKCDDKLTSYSTKASKELGKDKKKKLEFLKEDQEEQTKDENQDQIICSIAESNAGSHQEISQIDREKDMISGSLDIKKGKKSTRSNSKKSKNEDSFNIDTEVESSDNLGNLLEIKEHSITPLRRSRRGKSLFLDSASIEQESVVLDEVTVEQKTPLTKKQLIFSKLLLDEGTPKPSAHSTPEKQDLNKTEASEIFVDKKVLIPELSDKGSTDEIHHDKHKGTKRRISAHFSKKTKKKKSIDDANTTDELTDINKIQSEDGPDVTLNTVQSTVEIDVDSDKLIDVSVASDIKNSSDIKEQSEELNNQRNDDDKQVLLTEKRKNNNQISFDLSQSSKPKKCKLNKNYKKVEIASDDKCYDSDLLDPVPTLTSEPKTACYNLPLPARRARSKSVVVKSSNYDPYDIDLEDMVEQSHTFKRKEKSTDYVSKAKTNKYKSIKEVRKDPRIKETLIDKNNTDHENKRYEKATVSDSDDSSKSDVPLQKYVEEKEKKIQVEEANLSKEKDTKTSSDEQQNTDIKNANRCTAPENIPISQTQADEELRSEQFMESFGFFSERKPRKSNLLATKKISETFHITNESDDTYFGFKERTGKRNMTAETKKAIDIYSPKYHPQPSTSKRAPPKRGRRLKKTSTKIMPSYCGVCKKEFRRADNYLRHQMSLLHVSKLSEAELKVKTIPVHEEPNYLIAYKQYLERLKKLTDLLAKKKKKYPKAAAKIVLPTLEEVLADVNKTVRDQQRSARGLSRDEALFLDCCELLRESHKLGARGRRFGMSGLDILEKALDDLDTNENLVSDDSDCDSITAQNILESEEVRNLENDLISGLKEAANATRNANMEYHALNEFAAPQVVQMVQMERVEQLGEVGEQVQPETQIVNQPQEISQETQPEEFSEQLSSPSAADYDHVQDPDVPAKPRQVRAKKHFEVKEKMYPDILIEDIDMFEDKFDKIKRKCRSQAAAAAKQPQPVVDQTISHKGRKKSEKKKGKRSSKKARHQSTHVPTKGALKGFDGIRVSISTSDINMSAIVPVSERSPKKKKKSSSKKKRDKKDSESSSKYDSDHRAKDSSAKKVDVYEFMDNEDAELFEFRPSTLMERFKSISNNNKDMASTSKFNPVAEENSSQGSASDGDDFVYMSDDYVGSDDETENSLLSCELGNMKVGNDIKKTSPQKRKDVVEKNAVMGKIFKHNAVRAEKKVAVPKESEKTKANLDQLFDSLLEEEPNSSMLNSEAASPRDEDFIPAKKYNHPSKSTTSEKAYDETSDNEIFAYPSKSRSTTPTKNDSASSSKSSKRRSSSPSKDYIVTTRKHESLPLKKYAADKIDYEPSTSKKYDSGLDNMDYGPSTSKKYHNPMPKDCKKSSPKSYDSVHLQKDYEKSFKHYDKKTKKRKDSSSSKNSEEIFNAYDDNLKSPTNKPDEGISTSYDYNADAYEQSLVDDETGVARQRARRKCTVGKQNVLAETWSSESEPDGGPPRPNSAESDISGVGRKKKGRKKDGQQAGGRRGNSRQVAFKKQDAAECRVSSSRLSVSAASSAMDSSVDFDDPGEGPSGMSSVSTSASGGAAGSSASDSAAAAASAAMPAPSTSAVAGPSNVKGRSRSVAYYWSSEGDDEQEHLQQHGWIVGDSHKKLVTMLAHAKGRKRNNDDKRHLIE